MADLQPLPVNGATPAADPKPVTPTAPVSTERESSVSTPVDTGKESMVDSWIAEHPETPEAPVTEAVATTDASPSSVGEASTTSAASTAAASPTAATTPVEQAAVVESAPAAAAPTQQPQTLASDEKFEFAPGVAWTRSEIEQALRDRGGWQNEATEFRNTFGCTAEQLATTWKPLIAKLTPDTIKFIDAYLEGGEKAQYLAECATYFDTTATEAAPAAPAAPPAAALPPEVQRQITELSAWKAQRDTEDARNRFNTELAEAYQQYPILRDPQVWDDVRNRAIQLHQANPAHGLREAVSQMSRYLNALQAPATAAAPAPEVPAAPTVPALQTSSGATPPRARQTRTQPANPDTAVDRWLNGEARAAGFE